ncbi:MAG: hypothetical protein JO217_12125 [Acidobacteriaceae bacterium]|nr:hypothetical protein [Acidobacteriaceae bacterium]MBV9443432.1 hypothetical protein [Acidobacteriaceae bacterium]
MSTNPLKLVMDDLQAWIQASPALGSPLNVVALQFFFIEADAGATFGYGVLEDASEQGCLNGYVWIGSDTLEWTPAGWRIHGDGDPANGVFASFNRYKATLCLPDFSQQSLVFSGFGYAFPMKIESPNDQRASLLTGETETSGAGAISTAKIVLHYTKLKMTNFDTGE